MKQSRIGLIKNLLGRGASLSSVATYVRLREVLQDCNTVLDIGCGPNSPLTEFGFDRLVGIDGYPPAVAEAKRKRAYHDVILGDIREINRYFEPRQFDACVALDLIEHVSKKDGMELIAAMETIACRKVILITPSGFLPQRHAEQADLQEHISGWDSTEMTHYGFKVRGLLGPKPLRGEYHKLTRRPEIFWGLISLLGDLLYTQYVPSKAAAMLCYKKL